MRRVLVLCGVVVALLLGVQSSSAADSPTTGCESYSDSVDRLYAGVFLREPDQAGFDFWMGKYQSGQWSLPAMAEFFATSPEFQDRYGSLSNAQFIDRVYRNVLDRPPDQEGFEFWNQKLSDGLSRGRLVLRFTESPEYVTASGTSAAFNGPYNEGASGAWSCGGAPVGPIQPIGAEQRLAPIAEAAVATLLRAEPHYAVFAGDVSAARTAIGDEVLEGAGTWSPTLHNPAAGEWFDATTNSCAVNTDTVPLQAWCNVQIVHGGSAPNQAPQRYSAWPGDVEVHFDPATGYVNKIASTACPLGCSSNPGELAVEAASVFANDSSPSDYINHAYGSWQAIDQNTDIYGRLMPIVSGSARALDLGPYAHPEFPNCRPFADLLECSATVTGADAGDTTTYIVTSWIRSDTFEFASPRPDQLSILAVAVRGRVPGEQTSDGCGTLPYFAAIETLERGTFAAGWACGSTNGVFIGATSDGNGNTTWVGHDADSGETDTRSGAVGDGCGARSCTFDAAQAQALASGWNISTAGAGFMASTAATRHG